VYTIRLTGDASAEGEPRPPKGELAHTPDVALRRRNNVGEPSGSLVERRMPKFTCRGNFFNTIHTFNMYKT
jgi:hypothetical protein